MVKLFFLILKSSRPTQWIKNIAILTGLVFTGWLFYPQKLVPAMLAVIIFSLLSSSIYLFNDLVDISSDQRHPLKKNRPIASGKLPFPIALFTAIFFGFTSLFLAINLSFFFFLISLTYLILHLLYTFFLKRIPIIDVMTIASGFILRVWAGAVVINTHINIWLLLCVISFSLFLAVGKRRSELTLLKGAAADFSRRVLFSYPEKLLDLYISMFANTTWLTYAFFTFLQPSFEFSGRILTLMADLPLAFRSQKWLMATIPLVIYGIMRYLQLIYEKNEGESPEKVLLTDKPLLLSVILWGFMVVMIIYGI